MTYELAKKLKEAGFSQKERNGLTWNDICELGNCPEEKMKVPTLSELIEACGNKFGKIEFINDNQEYKWIATDCEGNKCWEKNPEEAVAKLWLELNKK